MTKIDAKYITKVYKDGEYALKNCSLSVRDGEFLVIVGASGAGKSTLLKVFAGTEKISCGELYFDGVLSDNIPLTQRNVSMAFQEYVLYPHLTVFENLAISLKLLHEDEKSIYDRVMGVLRLLNLEFVADVKPKRLSGGEQQRVALAKALLKRSKLILLDEPMSNVDEKSRWEYCRLLRKMKKLLPESTFIYVTHNPREALFLADRIAVMEDGRVIQVAPTRFLVNNFETLSAMEILGAAGNVSHVVYQKENCPLDERELQNIDYARLCDGEEITKVENLLNEDGYCYFDKNGKTLAYSSAEFRLDGVLEKGKLTFAGVDVLLDEDYASRLLAVPNAVSVCLEMDKFSKTKVENGFSLIFTVVNNQETHVLLEIDGKKVVLNKRTNLLAGERIRLYYKTEDVVLYDGDVQLTCHYAPRQKVDVKILDEASGKIEILGIRLKVDVSSVKLTNKVQITQSSFQLSLDKGKFAVAVSDCLDEEFINGQKLNHVAVKGQSGYLSLESKSQFSCFTKNKLWINIDPSKLLFV